MIGNKSVGPSLACSIPSCAFDSPNFGLDMKFNYCTFVDDPFKGNMESPTALELGHVKSLWIVLNLCLHTTHNNIVGLVLIV